MNSNELNNENYQILKDIYDELLYERGEIENQINNNLDEIKKSKLYLDSLFDKENTDYEVFSPRNIQNVYKSEIEEQKINRKNIEENNQFLYLKINTYDKKLNKLFFVLESIVKKENDDNINKNENCFIMEDNECLESDGIINLIENNKINYTILDIQEKERQRIARDLHDSTVQNLTHLIHKIELSSKFIDQDIIRAKMELISINKNVKTIIDDMRNIIFDLRPMLFDDIGTNAAFDKLLLELQEKTKMTIEFDIQNIIIEDKLIVMTVFHILQECCNNAIKHSKGTLLNVCLKQNDNQLFLIIQDDGIGFDLNSKIEDKHFGLTMVKERVSLLNGKIIIQAEYNKGTKININIPV